MMDIKPTKLIKPTKSTFIVAFVFCVLLGMGLFWLGNTQENDNRFMILIISLTLLFLPSVLFLIYCEYNKYFDKQIKFELTFKVVASLIIPIIGIIALVQEIGLNRDNIDLVRQNVELSRKENEDSHYNKALDFLESSNVNTRALGLRRLADIFHASTSTEEGKRRQTEINNSFFNLDFSLAQLEGVNFSHLNLTRVNFTGANLTDANFTGAILTGTIFDQADLSSSSFTQAIFTNSSFIEADLSSANLSFSNLSYANFDKATLYDADLSHSTLVNTRFRGANFQDAGLESAYIDKAQFQEANFEHTRFNNATIRQSFFQFASFFWVQFFGTTLEESDFRGADLSNVFFVKSILTTSEIDSKGLTNNFDGSYLNGVSFSTSVITAMSVKGAYTRWADRSNYNLQPEVRYQKRIGQNTSLIGVYFANGVTPNDPEGHLFEKVQSSVQQINHSTYTKMMENMLQNSIRLFTIGQLTSMNFNAYAAKNWDITTGVLTTSLSTFTMTKEWDKLFYESEVNFHLQSFNSCSEEKVYGQNNPLTCGHIIRRCKDNTERLDLLLTLWETSYIFNQIIKEIQEPKLRKWAEDFTKNKIKVIKNDNQKIIDLARAKLQVYQESGKENYANKSCQLAQSR